MKTGRTIICISVGSLVHVTGPRYLIFLCLTVVLTEGIIDMQTEHYG